MKKTILIGALAPLEGLVDDANPVVVMGNLKKDYSCLEV